MKQAIFAIASLFLLSAKADAQSAKLDQVKQLITDKGYSLTSDNGSNYVDLKKGEVGYVWKTFYKGDSYLVCAFSDDADVKDMDLFMEDEDGNTVLKDDDASGMAVVTYTPTRDVKLKVRYKNYDSKTPNYESRCRMLISYLSGGSGAANTTSGGLDAGKIDNAAKGKSSGSTTTNSARYDQVKELIESKGYKLSVDQGNGYVDLKQGEVGYVWKEFYQGDDYMVVAFSDDGDVKDMDLFLESESGTTVLKDDDASSMAVVTYTPTANKKLKVRYKNYKSDSPNYESRCRLLIAYLDK